MPASKYSIATTNVEGVFRRDLFEGGFVTFPQPTLELGSNGITGFNIHNGQFVEAGVRNDGFHKAGKSPNPDRVFNHRQITIIDELSAEYVANGLEIDHDVIAREFDESRTSWVARHMGTNVLVGSLAEGGALNDIRPPYNIGPFDEDDGMFTDAVLLVMSYNMPCPRPGRAMAEAYPGDNRGWGKRFTEVAEAHRGYVGVVSMQGTLAVGQEMMIVPLPVVPTMES